jgi:hypothetical protein
MKLSKGFSTANVKFIGPDKEFPFKALITANSDGTNDIVIDYWVFSSTELNSFLFYISGMKNPAEEGKAVMQIKIADMDNNQYFA